jgi:hypothetical protein
MRGGTGATAALVQLTRQSLSPNRPKRPLAHPLSHMMHVHSHA